MAIRINHGAHLVTDRGLYSHHGIYTGKGNVIHFTGPKPKWNAAVRREPFTKFLSGGTTIQVRRYKDGTLAAKETCQLANEICQRYEKGQGEQYNLVFNNCEHVATLCKTGVHESRQVDDVISALIGDDIPDRGFTDAYVGSLELDRILEKCDDIKALRPSPEEVAGHIKEFLRRSGIARERTDKILKGIEKKWFSDLGVCLLNSSGKRVVEVAISIDWKASSVPTALSPVVRSSVGGLNDIAVPGLQAMGARLKKRAKGHEHVMHYWVSFTPVIREDPERYERLCGQVGVKYQSPPPAWKSEPKARGASAFKNEPLTSA